MKINFDRYNQKVKNWGKDSVTKMKAEGRALGIIHRADSPSKSASIPKLSSGFRQKDGQVNRVSIKFPRTLIYTHKGAGKGRGGTKGSRWTDKYGKAKKTKESSMGKMGTAGRTAKPFINRVLKRETGVDQLATIVAVETGAAISNNMFIK
ncbi:hypothetical protein ACTJIJ_19905 [Niabella sp. 22666]|uniref:hypothetical protein n=1 Tax=Niabella sp. 22666 TaxID=3453954 RepID=UPI003F84ABDE